MRLHHYKAANGNVGDDLNPWLWERLIPGLFGGDDGTLFVGIGTLLNDRLPHARRTVVFGTGVGYGTCPAVPDASWTVYCVRGPITAAALGLSAELAITDPAALVATLGVRTHADGRAPAFMPHHLSAPLVDWSTLCSDASLRFIDPRWSVDEVLGSLKRTSLLITEAMHGAILADALRVPWIPTVCAEQILALKWVDWCRSMGLHYQPLPLPLLWNVESNLSVLKQGGRVAQRAAARAGLSGFVGSPTAELHPALRDAVRETFHRIVRGGSRAQ
ncbi:MAG: polysaccharide pyruvyl transferase family protein [Verrucomicrobiota bacterium]